MSVETIWQRYQQEGYSAICDLPFETAEGAFYRAILAFGENDLTRAVAAATYATEHEPENLVYAQSAEYLRRVIEGGKAAVYVEGEAFAAFVRGGGNVNLYELTSSALRLVYGNYEMLSLLDVGVGDGMALLPALTKNIVQLDLIEPSEAMLAQTTNQLDAWKVSYRAHHGTIQDFMEIGKETGYSTTWDVIQATWSLQSLPPDQRPAVFEWLRRHGKRLLIAEFDVPNFPNMFGPERVRHILDRYQRGLAECEDDGGHVAQGFLIPVMFGYFDRTGDRTNYEGPIQDWIDGLRAAGFTSVEKRLIYEYWWADSYLLDAE